MVELAGIEQWPLSDHSPPSRILWVTPRWTKEFNALPASPPRTGSLTRRPGPRDALGALASAFVRGEPKFRLVRPRGEGSEPIFRRMRPPRSCVVEFRTWDTRTFGFFAKRDIFVACTVGLADELKKQSLYGAYGERVVGLLARLLPTEYDCKTDVEDLYT
ncbi:MAG: hypothetical protein ACP5NP_09685 [Acetobacteraceae bacterium]